MSKDTIFALLPYALFYILIFRDPYSTLIPVTEPQLRYSPETTWLLHDKDAHPSFSAAYYATYQDRLENQENAYPYFAKAFLHPDYSAASQSLLGNIQPAGSNQSCVPLHQALYKNMLAGTEMKSVDFIESDEFKNNKAAIQSIIAQISIPQTCRYYEEPQLSSLNDQAIHNNLLMQYVISLRDYAVEHEDLETSLTQLRLLANTSSPKILELIIQTYIQTLASSSLSMDAFNQLNQRLPAWPHLHDLYTRLQRAQLVNGLIEQSREFKALEQLLKADDPDYFLDKNHLLQFINEFYTSLAQRLPNKHINQLNQEDLDQLRSINPADMLDDDQRSLADRILFAGSIEARHARAGRWFGSAICEHQYQALVEVLQAFYDFRKNLPTENSDE